MLTEEDFIALWKDLKSDFPKESEDTLAPIFAVEILRRWGWPYKPTSISESYPPVNQTFLGFYPETGWMMAHWKQGFVPLPGEVPTYWLSMNILPNPESN